MPDVSLAPLESLGRPTLALLGDGTTALLAALLLPLVVAVLVAVTGRFGQNVRDGLTTIGSALTFLAVCGVYAAYVGGDIGRLQGIEMFPGVPIAFDVEPLGLVFALVASSLWVPTSIYAFGYMRSHHEQNQTRFFVCFALAIFAALAIAFSANLATLFLFYEVLTFSTFPLVAHHQSSEAQQAGRVYLGVLVGSSICLFLLGVIWVYDLAGTLDFRSGGLLEGTGVGAGTVLILSLCFAYGLGKAALMPLHRWLPAAMVAPTPVSALLHAVAVVKAGVFGIVKVFAYVLGVDFLARTLDGFELMTTAVGTLSADDVVAILASFTILSASIVAMRQDNLKRRLAYSTISQLSYIVLAAGLLHSLGLTAGTLHIVTHAIGKITLFFCAGAIYVASHQKDLSKMSGLGRRMPWTYGAFFVASLSIIGLPPFVGSWSKWALFIAAFETGRWWVAVVLVISSLLAIGYLLPVVLDGFFGGRGEQAHSEVSEAPWLCVGPLVWTAFLCLATFFLIDEWQRLALLVGTGLGGSNGG